MKVRQRDRAQLLGQVPLFSYCSQRELAKVAKLANELELPAGHTLIHEDAEVAYSFFVLVDGEAEVRRRNGAMRPSGRTTASVSWRSSCAGPEPPR
jgi:CRP-like cAMP-binding protein